MVLCIPRNLLNKTVVQKINAVLTVFILFSQYLFCPPHVYPFFIYCVRCLWKYCGFWFLVQNFVGAF